MEFFTDFSICLSYAASKKYMEHTYAKKIALLKSQNQCQHYQETI